jgi:hypothetical protein
VSHAFKGKSQVWKNVLVREISKTAPAGTEYTKLRQREKAKQHKIATLKKIEPSMVNSIPTDLLTADNKVIFSNSTGTATAKGKGAFTYLLHTMLIVNDEEGTGCQMVVNKYQQ